MLGLVRFLPLLSVALSATIPPLPQASPSLQDVVDFYNKGTNSDYLYRLVEEVSAEETRPGRIQFVVKETECLKSEVKNIEDCKFQESAVLKACTAFLAADQKTDAVVINCDSPVTKRNRVRRARPWNCSRRGGCFSAIGSQTEAEKEPQVSQLDLDFIRYVDPVEKFRKESGWIQSPDLDSDVLGSYYSRLLEKDIPRGHTQHTNSRNPSEVIQF